MPARTFCGSATKPKTLLGWILSRESRGNRILLFLFWDFSAFVTVVLISSSYISVFCYLFFIIFLKHLKTFYLIIFHLRVFSSSNFFLLPLHFVQFPLRICPSPPSSSWRPKDPMALRRPCQRRPHGVTSAAGTARPYRCIGCIIVLRNNSNSNQRNDGIILLRGRHTCHPGDQWEEFGDDLIF